MKKFIIKTTSKFSGKFTKLALVLFGAFVFRLFIANFGTLQLDHGTFVAWGNSLYREGFKNFYNGWSDYLPGYLYILWLLGKLNSIFPAFEEIIFKLPAITADILTGALIYQIVSNLKNRKWGLLFCLFYLFNPAVFSNSSLWGQVDTLVVLFSLLSIYLFSKNYLLSAIFLAIGTLVKPQAAFVSPAVFYLMIKNKTPFYKMVFYAVIALGIFALAFIPFNNMGNFFDFVINRLTVSANQYPYGSVNAFSFWGLLGFWKPDSTTVIPGIIAAVIFIVISFVIALKKLNKKGGEYFIAAISFLSTFLFLTRMHERHLLPTLAPILIYSAINPSVLVPYFGLSLTYVANLQYAFVWITKEFKEIFNPLIIKFFIVINLLLLIFTFVISTFDAFRKKVEVFISSVVTYFRKKGSLLDRNNFKSKDISLKTAKVFISLILGFSLLTRLFDISLPPIDYFDEIYHAFTARLVLHNDPKAWEWWNPHPEGFAYEWTHPPLSKLGMALGMTVFGENTFGWRVPQAILGTLAVLIVYLLAYEIFKDRLLGLFAAFIFSLDGLQLTLSRMGMNDSYVLFFSLFSLWLFIKNKNFFSAISLGLAVASKWSAIYITPIIFVSHFIFKKKIRPSYVFFFILPIIAYIASYLPMFLTNHTWSQFVEMQKQMWWYHTNLNADHPYTSPALSWPIMLRPVYLYTSNELNGWVARIYAIGNPFVFWFGLISFLLTIFISFKERIKKLGFVIFSYLIFFVPWIASPRIMFIYHYLPSIPFMTILTAFTLRRFPKVAVYVLGSIFLVFIYFYPHWAGLNIPLWLDKSYYWFPSWR